MMVRDSLRLGDPVEAAGRVLTPVLRIRYTVASGGGFGSVDPLGFVLDEDGKTYFYPFDPLRNWDWVLARLAL